MPHVNRRPRTIFEFAVEKEGSMPRLAAARQGRRPRALLSTSDVKR
jgi:hypothetical protein